jgi:sulfoquinovosidase
MPSRSGPAWRSLSSSCLLGCVASLALASGADAAVEVGAERVTVTGEGARAVVERDPFRLSFEDPATGETVLREVARDLPAPTPGANVEPEPGGVDLAPEVARYAPLVFEVGVEKGAQQPAGLWTGNMLVDGRAGVFHHATAVTRAEPAGEGVRLEVETTDPSRALDVLVEPDGTGAIRVRASFTGPAGSTGVAAIGDAFESRPGEAFHGFGGRRNAIDQRGQDFYNWIEEEAIAPGDFEPATENLPGTGGDRYTFPNGPHSAYYVQNLFVSSRPYGFLLANPELSRWRMAADREDAWQVSTASKELDYTVAVGDGAEAAGALTAINGRHRLPPEWAQGALLKQAVRNGSDSTASYAARVEEDMDQIEARGLDAASGGTVEGYSYEAWDGMRHDPAFGSTWVREVNDRLRAMGIHPIGYVRAYVNDEGMFDPDGIFAEAVDFGYVAMLPGGAPFVGVAVGPAAVIDFTDPCVSGLDQDFEFLSQAELRECPHNEGAPADERLFGWWEWRKLRPMLDLGFDGFMQDFGEQVQEDMVFENGETGRTMHNRYPVVYHRVTRTLVERWEEENPERGEVFMYTRSGFSGRAGSAASENSNFPGDETIGWDRSFGLQSLATDMLSRSIGGSWGYTTDIGGYLGANPTPKELFVRWSQWSALTPFFRVHNGGTAGTQMPWEFDAETLRLWSEAAELHRLARGLVARLWRQGAETGIPPTRPLWLAFPGDAEAAKQDQQWMLGEDVLVAPVVTEGATTRELYLPAGCWRRGDAEGRPAGETYESEGEYVTVAAPLDSLPYFIRCGTDPFAAEPPDTTPPETEITSPLGVLHPGESAQATFRASEEGASFACAIDSGAFAPCTSPHTVRADEHAPGRHVLRVRATDAAANADPTPAREYFHVAGPRPAQGPAEAQSEGAPPAGAEGADQGTAAPEGESAREAKLRRCLRKARAISDRKERRKAVRACRERWGA